MSQSSIDFSLSLLGYASLEEVTPSTLKERFKAAAKRVHPDHGGSEMEFDRILTAYTDLMRICRRQSGGRAEKSSAIYVDDVKEHREQQWVNEMNHTVSDVLDQLLAARDDEKEHTFLTVFNQTFDKAFLRETDHGYGAEEWFHSTATDDIQPPAAVAEEEFHKEFERRAKEGKPLPTTLILHPEQMALRPVFLGYDPSRIGDYTADMYSCPEFTDLKEAYDTQTTLIDKLPPPVSDDTETPIVQFEIRLKERGQVYLSEADRDLELIAAYERTKEKEWKENKERMEAYFASTGSSVWALRGGDTHNL